MSEKGGNGEVYFRESLLCQLDLMEAGRTTRELRRLEGSELRIKGSPIGQG